ncbi:MAG: phospholipid carrier-dependent glycosyltransferase [Opitutaceae bacterium]|nr:phospholipid carrier-dependent glycosyltransferase [Opitutaceae bacterium]
MWASRGQSTTSDELAHLTGGYTFNHWNDYRLHPENGLLPQRWQALPLSLGTAPIFPSLDSTDWREANVWKLGHHFFYEAGNDHAPLLRQARAMNSFFGAALTLLVFFWSRKIWGTVGAMSSAIFCAFCPTLLAHSGLATSDLAAAFFLLASTGAYWRHLHDHRPQWWWLSLTAFGLACVAKYTAVLLLPIFGLLVLVRALSPQPLMLAGRSLLRRRAKWIGLIISLSTHGLASPRRFSRWGLQHFWLGQLFPQSLSLQNAPFAAGSHRRRDIAGHFALAKNYERQDLVLSHDPTPCFLCGLLAFFSQQPLKYRPAPYFTHLCRALYFLRPPRLGRAARPAANARWWLHRFGRVNSLARLAY